MKFTRCPWNKGWKKPITARSISAAKRRLDRERDAVALLPDLASAIPTINQEVEAMTKAMNDDSDVVYWRARWAANWRCARRELECLPEQSRRGLLKYWSRWSGPSTPEYLLTFIQEAKKGTSFWSKLRELRQYQLIGERRFPEDRIKAVFARHLQKPGPLGRGPAFFAKRHAAKRRRRQGEREVCGVAVQTYL